MSACPSEPTSTSPTNAACKPRRGASRSSAQAMAMKKLGSIGTMAIHQDLSRQFEADGIDTTVISAGKYKAEANLCSAISQSATSLT